ncbi:MAG TPA: ribosome recycling factor [Chitinophagaceae bacterium]|nr:ribosome recycling factor [Chitinophagaceae bacterium]
MSEQAEKIKKSTSESMKRSLEHLERELIKIRAGKASPSMVDGIMVEYYGSPTPINQVANITVSDARTLTLQPWEKPMIAEIEKAIQAANIGVNPQNDGEIIRLFLPPLTEERRKDLVKQAYAEGEQGKISIRNVRRDGIDSIKTLEKEGLSEDQVKFYEQKIQELTDFYIEKIDNLCKAKEKDIMTI